MLSIVELDFGTPKKKSEKQIALSIDGFDVTVPEGTSVMRAAATIGINIPKLCATELLDAFGSCRLCLVQVEGMKGYPASCTTPVTHGMKVTTQNPKLGESALRLPVATGTWRGSSSHRRENPPPQLLVQRR